MLETTLLNFIESLDTSFRRILAETSGAAHVTASQVQYIDAVQALGQPTMTEIAQELGISKASVTVAVNKLVVQGYLTKQQSEQDKRVYRISLTKSSQRLIQAKQQALHAYVAFIQQALEPTEVSAFERSMQKLIQAFHNQVSGVSRHQSEQKPGLSPRQSISQKE